MSLRAVRDVVVVRILYADKIGEFYIPDKAKQYSGKFTGEVIAIGSEYPDKSLKVGDKILSVRHEGVPVDYRGERLWALKSDYCLGVEDEN